MSKRNLFIPFRRVACFFGFILLCGLFSRPEPLLAQYYEDFSGANDTNWVHYEPLKAFNAGGVGTWSFPTGAYRIQTTGSTDHQTRGPARAGSVLANVVYTNFYISVDLVAWDDELDQVFGLLARLDHIGFGQTTGYGLACQNHRGGPGTGAFYMVRMTGERSTVLAGLPLQMNPLHQYRMIMQGNGSTISGQLLDLTDRKVAPLSIAASDTTYQSGGVGLLVWDQSVAETNRTDATYDNFFADSEPPPALQIAPMNNGDIVVSWTSSDPHYHLEGCDDLSKPVWVDLQIEVFPLDNSYFFFTGQSPKQFYRLVWKH